ncbi:MAG TPA: divalent-cation tolerance protein CutA [Nitrospiria bacterium]|nr:divalent-cation tolerance protein CutA [Nitrospiria bacterium]
MANDEDYPYIVVLITFPSEAEARKITRVLVKENLLACGNIISGVTSIYRWEGKIAEAVEILMVGKTRREVFLRLEARVKALHPYRVPEIIALPLVEAYSPYLSWIDESVR